MPATMLLDRTTWDLVADLDGNIAKASEPYALAQDAASAIKLFLGELWYDTTQGIPYWTEILGKPPPITLMKAKFTAAALTVPNVIAARVTITSFVNRTIRGKVEVTDTAGVISSASF